MQYHEIIFMCFMLAIVFGFFTGLLLSKVRYQVKKPVILKSDFNKCVELMKVKYKAEIKGDFASINDIDSQLNVLRDNLTDNELVQLDYLEGDLWKYIDD